MPGDPCTPVANLATAIPGGAGTFTGFSAVSTSRGHVAFLGQGPSGQAGIYVASTLQKVIAVGDRLDGKVVASLRLGQGGLDGNRLGFAATFTDGSEGVFVAELDLVPNAPPVAIDDEATVSEDDSVTIDVVANDADPDGDPLTVLAVTAPAHGSVANNGDGTVTYTPVANFNGSDAFTYTVGDGQGGTATARVAIDVTPVNDPPVALGDSYSVVKDTALTVAAPGVLANDGDVDGDALSALLVSGAAHGQVSLEPSGSFVYVPAAGYSGSRLVRVPGERRRGQLGPGHRQPDGHVHRDAGVASGQAHAHSPGRPYGDAAERRQGTGGRRRVGRCDQYRRDLRPAHRHLEPHRKPQQAALRTHGHPADRRPRARGREHRAEHRRHGRRQRRDLEPSDRDLDAHGQPRPRPRAPHRDAARERQGPGGRRQLHQRGERRDPAEHDRAVRSGHRHLGPHGTAAFGAGGTRARRGSPTAGCW